MSVSDLTHMNKQIFRIGTRGSKLAMYQAETVKNAIEQSFTKLQVELCIIKTKGDIILDTALSKIGDKGLFTREIELALLDRSIDIAVHSLKDLPTTLPDCLHLGAVLPRGEVRDALVHKKGKKLHELNHEDLIATSSLRRIASLKHLNPNIRITDIRGNVNTRLEKMHNGFCDGMIMAAAGLQRLGYEKHITELIEPDHFYPAVAQGAIAIECRVDDPETNQMLQSINHPHTMLAVQAERSFLQNLEGGCQIPAGCYSIIGKQTIQLKAFIASPGAEEYLSAMVEGTHATALELGKQLAMELKNLGGAEIMKQIRTT